jgi:hypothetical protein
MKTIIISITLFLSINCMAQIKPIFEVAGGYNKFASSVMVNLNPNLRYAATIYKYPIYTDIIIGATWKKFTVKQRIENYFGYIKGTSFTPKQFLNTTTLFYTYNRFEFGFEHFCSHPIVNNQIYDNYYRASYNKLYIKIKIL